MLHKRRHSQNRYAKTVYSGTIEYDDMVAFMKVG